MNEKLNPCICCENELIELLEDKTIKGNNYYTIRCLNCNLKSTGHNCKNEAIKKWNSGELPIKIVNKSDNHFIDINFSSEGMREIAKAFNGLILRWNKDLNKIEFEFSSTISRIERIYLVSQLLRALENNGNIMECRSSGGFSGW